MNIKIRQAVPNDLEEITKIESICFPKEEAATKESLKYRIETFPNSFFVATYNGKIIGFVNGAVTNCVVNGKCPYCFDIPWKSIGLDRQGFDRFIGRQYLIIKGEVREVKLQCIWEIIFYNLF